MNNIKIDSLIAVNIFNWKWEEVSYNGMTKRMLVPPITDERLNWTAMWDANGIPHYLPKYSTHLSDTWLIVEKLKQEDQYYFVLENGDLYDYECYFDDFIGADNNPSMAICKAALKVKNVDITGEM